MAFHRTRCTIVMNIVLELKPVFKNRKKRINQCFTIEKNIIYDALFSKF